MLQAEELNSVGQRDVAKFEVEAVTEAVELDHGPKDGVLVPADWSRKLPCQSGQDRTALEPESWMASEGMAFMVTVPLTKLTGSGTWRGCRRLHT